MAKRYYSVDDNLDLDWVDIDKENILDGITRPYFYRVVAAKDGNTDFKFWLAWIYSEQNPGGVWHETPQGVAKQLRAKARQIEKIPVHPF